MKLDNKTEQILAEINQLLVAADLVPVNLNSDNLHFFYKQDESGRIVGIVGIEVYPNGALLRSLAVRVDFRNKGIARALIEEAYAFARGIKCYNLYLLTETIGDTMYRYGFRDIRREQVPSDLLASPFFNGICPCSCQLMHQNIQEG